MKQSITKTFFKIIKGIFVAIVAFFLLLLAMPYLLPNTISQKIKQLANESLQGELGFSNARLSFFNHFPSLTLTLYNFSLKGSVPFQQDTLLAAKEVAFGINLRSLLSQKININQIFLTEANINVQVDSAGHANYNVYAAKPAAKNAAVDTVGASLKIERIVVEKTNLVYNDRSLPMLVKARGLNYQGQGDLSRAIFDLDSHIGIDSIDFSYNKQSYVVSKKLHANLVTKINTNSLAFFFQKNDLLINQLPVQFNGYFKFLKNGYDMDFNVASNATDLYNVITAMPLEYVRWLAKTDVKGTADIALKLAGQFIASTNTMPSLSMNLGIRSGYINHQQAPAPISNLFLNFETKLPGLNPDSLYLNIDSIYFNLNKDYFSSVIQVKGLKTPQLYAKINTQLDLEKWNRAIGLPQFAIKGICDLHLLAEGKYATGQNPENRKPDTVITAIPTFSLQTQLRNGYFKWAKLPAAVENIGFTLAAKCPDGIYQHTNLSVENMNATVLTNYIKGFFKIIGGQKMQVDANVQSVFKLSDIKAFYPLSDSIDVQGNLKMNVVTKGNIDIAKKIFPTTDAHLLLNDGQLKTFYYPHPITNIQVDANISNTDGTAKTVKVNLKPIRFLFEGQPFSLKANVQNLDNVRYNIASNGTLDVGKIYKVFSQKGWDVSGTVATNLSLKGLQSDAVAGLYEKLQNSGSLTVKKLQVSSELFPAPFFINTGKFSFKDDKIWFDSFTAKYRNSDFELKGYLTNVINYATKNQPVAGGFVLNSKKIVVDEFTAFADTNASKKQGTVSSNGVVNIPKNLNLQIEANAQSVWYNGLQLTNAKGALQIDSGNLVLKQTGFTVAGAMAVMDATYHSLTPTKAYFEYHVSAKEFDIQRAYNEIKLFRDMATSAKSAQGVASLDYSIKGKLNKNMYPIFPSLEGGGTFTIKQAKMKGFKLFSAVSKAAEKDSLGNANLKKVEIKTTIKNNIITLAPLKMRVFGFRPKLQGQVSFNGQLNLKFRLGLPPLGIFGIPMTITGTQENPKIKIGKGKKEDELKEEQEKEGDSVSN